MTSFQQPTEGDPRWRAVQAEEGSMGDGAPRKPPVALWLEHGTGVQDVFGDGLGTVSWGQIPWVPAAGTHGASQGVLAKAFMGVRSGSHLFCLLGIMGKRVGEAGPGVSLSWRFLELFSKRERWSALEQGRDSRGTEWHPQW